MVPLLALINLKRIVGPELIERFNAFPSVKFMGSPAPGFSSGQALNAIEKIASQFLTNDYSIGWVGAAFQEKVASGAGSKAFIFGIITIFLILAAQYEKWTLPFAVISAVPFAVLGALIAVWLRGLTNDLYLQIGLLTLIGLSAKNAILIVEFALLKRNEGLNIVDAVLEAVILRFRPIIMTSMAFILGCVPLYISKGAGAASHHSIGTGVIGGMLTVTFLATLFVPLFFKLISQIFPDKIKE
jgi:multidrug efflux pump subunit AcrB